MMNFKNVGKALTNKKVLSQIGKQVLTTAGLNHLLNAFGPNMVKRSLLSKMVGSQNIDPQLADRVEKAFKEVNQLQGAKVKESIQPSSFSGADNTVRGPSKRIYESMKRRGLAKGKVSIDDPAIRLHELGHAATHKNKKWHSSLRGYRTGLLGGAVAGLVGKLSPRRAAFASALAAASSVPILVDEWKASASAKEFVDKTLPAEEAKRVHKILNLSFGTYLAGAATATAAPFIARAVNKRSAGLWSGSKIKSEITRGDKLRMFMRKIKDA